MNKNLINIINIHFNIFLSGIVQDFQNTSILLKIPKLMFKQYQTHRVEKLQQSKITFEMLIGALLLVNCVNFSL